MKKPILYIMCGLSGSGKSTIATQIANENPNTVIVSSDSIREELTGDYGDMEHNEEVFKVFHKRIREALENKHNVIADAAYSIQEENERKSVEIATADADLAKQEKAVEIKEKEIALTEKTLEATVKKQAEAEKYAKQQEADGIRSKGQAEADAIKAKALAEAEGIQKKAEAMKQMGEAAVLDMYFKAMPEIAKNIAEPLAKVDKITMYGDGNSSKLMKDIMNTLNQVTDGMKESTGIDLNSILAGFAGAKLADNGSNK